MMPWAAISPVQTADHCASCTSSLVKAGQEIWQIGSLSLKATGPLKFLK